jgi:uncharacterized membrane protein
MGAAEPASARRISRATKRIVKSALLGWLQIRSAWPTMMRRRAAQIQAIVTGQVGAVAASSSASRASVSSCSGLKVFGQVQSTALTESTTMGTTSRAMSDGPRKKNRAATAERGQLLSLRARARLCDACAHAWHMILPGRARAGIRPRQTAVVPVS